MSGVVVSEVVVSGVVVSEVVVSGVVGIIEVYPDTFNINWQYMIKSDSFMPLTVELNCLSVASWMLEMVAEKTFQYATYSHYDYNNRIL